MAIKFNVNGVPVEADSAQEAAELIRALGLGKKSEFVRPAPSFVRDIPWSSAVQAVKRHPTKFKLRFKRKNGFDVRSQTEAFLVKVSEAGKNGATAEMLMEVIGARHPKGIGSKSAAINDYLEKLGFDPSDVYDNPRTAEGRIWKSGPKILDAIEAVKAA